MKTIKLGDLSVHLTDSFLDLTKRYKQYRRHQPESGGILLGQVRQMNVYLMKGTIPNALDKATRMSFNRDKLIAQVIMDYEFENSGNRTIYLGEWHTHPEEIPSPSNVDAEMIKDQFFKNKLNEPFVLLFIQGTHGYYVGKYDGIKLLGREIHE